MKRWPVAILGATGAVGQTFVRLLADHPWFEVHEVASSARSAGRPYSQAAQWLEGPMPRAVSDKDVLPCDPSVVTSPVVFSALAASAAQEVEAAFAAAGKLVLSNARSYRMEPDVPLVVPEINGDHLSVLLRQRRERGWPGAIVTNANCAATVAALALAPLHQRFGLRSVSLATMQAVSGAGYPGVPSFDIVGNVIPFIEGEEEKIERELCKLLGTFRGETIAPAEFAVSVHANRVPVEHGHTVCISASFEADVSPDDALATLREWRGFDGAVGLPSAPERALVLFDDRDRPQPRRDVQLGRGMSVSVGRVRGDRLFDVRLVALGHNMVRGAAGCSIMNAELLATMGEFPDA